MGNEIERLRADLEVLERYYDENYCGPNKVIRDLKNKISEIEKAEQAGSWWQAEAWVVHQKTQGLYPNVTKYIDHLTAENARLEKRVAELEAVASEVTALLEMTDEASDPCTDTYAAVTIANAALADMQPPSETALVESELAKFIEADADEPGPLKPGRVLATAAVIYEKKGLPLSGGMCRKDSMDAKPYRLKGAGDEQA